MNFWRWSQCSYHICLWKLGWWQNYYQNTILSATFSLKWLELDLKIFYNRYKFMLQRIFQGLIRFSRCHQPSCCSRRRSTQPGVDTTSQFYRNSVWLQIGETSSHVTLFYNVIADSGQWTTASSSSKFLFNLRNEYISSIK